MNEIIQLFLLALLGSIIALAGGVVFLFNRKLSSSLQKHSVPFAAGVLITVALLVLLPESFEQIGETSLLVVLASFFGAYLFENFFFHIHHHDADYKIKKSQTALVIFGDTIHNFIDGIAIAVSFFVNPGLGLITAFSTFLHEIPHEIGDFGILLKAGWRRKNILIVNAISASFTIIGAFVTFFIAQNNTFVGIMLAVSAGIFLYLGAIDFLPNIGKEYKNKFTAVIPLALGIAIMLATVVLVPHAHEDEEDDHTEEIEIHEGELFVP
jgi:zinc and cadmium transporter